MKWTYTAVLTLKSGDTIDFITNPEYNHIQYSTQGDAQGSFYLSANISPRHATVNPPSVTAGGVTNTFSVGGSPVAVDSGVKVSPAAMRISPGPRWCSPTR